MQRLKEDESVAESAKMRRGARRAMGARMYMPEIGRFLSVYPLAEAFPTQSPYNFALNNPINFRDPSGLAPVKEKGDMLLGTAVGTLRMSMDNWNLSLTISFFGTVENNITKVIAEANEFYQSRYNDNMRCVDAIAYENFLLTRAARLARSSFRFGFCFGNGGGSNGVSKGVWQITNSWSPEMKDGYAKFYTKRTAEAKENKEKYDCCDFQVRMITEYARDNGLPLSFMTRGGKELNMQDYKDFDSFWNDVSSALSAKNLDLLYNTETFDTEGIFLAGDMKLIKFVDHVVNNSFLHVVGYTGLSGSEAIVQGNLFTSNNAPAQVEYRKDYTIISSKKFSVYNILGYDDGDYEYGTKTMVLRWNFNSFQNRKKR